MLLFHRHRIALRKAGLAAVAILFAVLTAWVTLAEVQEPVVRGVRATVPPVIDGRLGESCWRLCTPATDFFMVEPNPGALVTQPTHVYVCYDDEKIYFGIHMSEAKPDKMQAAANQRDGSLYMDDSFEIILDTYCDRRNGYYFMSNLISAKLDGRIVDEGRNIDETWDAHWETKAQLVEDGWEMEIAIPFSEMNFALADTLVWGINFWRVERPHWESTSWSPVQKWCQVSKYGTLTGISIRPKIKRLEILPYTAVRYEHDSLSFNAGIDLEYDLTSDLILNATLWPDFAQIEADPFRFNLSYQEGEELYFPEKRPFFLEGGGILKTPLQLFYTRRMNEILAGGKVYGKIGSTELLALDAHTKDTDENFSVLRVKQEILGTATLGGLLTHKEGSRSVSEAAAVDLNLSMRGPFLFSSQFAATRNTGISGDRWAGNIGVEGETGSYGAGLSASRIGSDFSIEQGFIGAYDIGRQSVSGWGWAKLLQKKGWVQWIDAGSSFDIGHEIGGGLSHLQTEFWANVVTQPKWRLGCSGEREFERYGESEYVNRTIGFEVESNVGGMTGVASSFAFGRLYNSRFRFFHCGFLVLPLTRISVFPIFQAMRLGDTRWQWLTNIRISFQMTEKAFLRLFLQAESDTGSEANEALCLERLRYSNANFLFGCEFSPGTILYLVYNRPHDFDTGISNHIFVAKFTYCLRL